MTNSKLIIYLKTLSNAEMKDFGLFLSISKGAKDAIVLFRYLNKYHPTYAAKVLDKDTVASKLFPKDKNKAKKLINTMQRCSRLLNGFLVQEELKTNEVNKDFLLLQALKNRKLDTYFFRKAEQIEKDWEKKQPPGLQHLHDKYRLKEMYSNHPKYAFQKNQIANIQNIVKDIDEYYFGRKLYLHLLLWSNSQYLKNLEEQTETKNLLNAIISIGLKNNDQVPQVRFLSNLYSTLIKNDFNNYNLLKDSFVENIDLYSHLEKHLIMMILFSICYQNYQSGKAESLHQLFELNCLMVDSHLIIYDSYVQTDQFWNIVNIGLTVKEIEWTENFIKEFGCYLPNNEKEDVLTVCMAMVHFYKKEFDEALRQLLSVKFKNILYAVHARNIQLKCYYELGADYEEMFWDFTKSFYMFLIRNKSISNKIKVDLKNYIAICKELYGLQKLTTPAELISIEKKLKNNTNVASKSWLIEKLEEIKKRTTQSIPNYSFK